MRKLVAIDSTATSKKRCREPASDNESESEDEAKRRKKNHLAMKQKKEDTATFEARKVSWL